MSRAEYHQLRSTARAASRRYWNISSGKGATPYDRDSAYQRMRECEQKVPGGLLSSLVEDRVLLPGWVGRRCNVNRAIRERKARESRERVLGLMAQYCGRDVA